MIWILLMMLDLFQEEMCYKINQQLASPAAPFFRDAATWPDAILQRRSSAPVSPRTMQMLRMLGQPRSRTRIEMMLFCQVWGAAAEPGFG